MATGLLKVFSGKIKADAVVEFLNKADDAYMLAYDTKRFEEFAKYAAPQLVKKIREEVLSGEVVYFGLEKYRKREWVYEESDGIITVYKKGVTHEHVRVTKQVLIPLGDDVLETWKLKRDINLTIIDIRRSSHDATRTFG